MKEKTGFYLGMGAIITTGILTITAVSLSYINIMNKLSKTDSLLNKLEKTLSSSQIPISSVDDSHQRDLHQQLKATYNFYNDEIKRLNKIEFPHIKNFEVHAKNLGIPRSELRSLQRYFKAYNDHVGQNTKKYPINL